LAPALSKGSDGRPRCWWGASTPAPSAKQRAVPAANDDLLERYHDEEWGRPVRDERGLYERMVLEGFQSGLSWLTILRKRESFRAAFAGFDIESVAKFGDRDVNRLLGDAGIVRHRGKIEAAIANAKAAAAMHANGESLGELVWSFAPGGRRRAPRSPEDLNAITPESTALSKELKKRGFRFVGPTTAYATMQACGVVNDHLAGCWVRAAVEKARRA
jgi:DNA-3-methyladenine glycosylase I